MPSLDSLARIQICKVMGGRNNISASQLINTNKGPDMTGTQKYIRGVTPDNRRVRRYYVAGQAKVERPLSGPRKALWSISIRYLITLWVLLFFFLFILFAPSFFAFSFPVSLSPALTHRNTLSISICLSHSLSRSLLVSIGCPIRLLLRGLRALQTSLPCTYSWALRSFCALTAESSLFQPGEFNYACQFLPERERRFFRTRPSLADFIYLFTLSRASVNVYPELSTAFSPCCQRNKS